MNKSWYLLLIIVGLVVGCTEKTGSVQENYYLRWVGDSQFDSTKDNSAFSICHDEDQVYQYFNLSEGPVYLNEKPALVKEFKELYRPINKVGETGMIRIRFVVNCEGKAGRFRLISSDEQYKPKEFAPEITTQLLKITKNIDQWAILKDDNQAIDYYMYLVFKLKDGQIIEILP